MAKLRKFLNERVVTFDKQAFPKEGHLVVVIGGAGSGKSFVLKNIIPITGKILSTDVILEILAKKKKIDIANPKELDRLYRKLRPSYVDLMTNFFETISNKNKPNIIFDITGRSIPTQILPILPKLEKVGYKTTLVYVTVNREKAWERNVKRGRTIGREEFDAIHDDVIGIAEVYKSRFDNVWVVDNSSDEPQWWKKYPERIEKIK